MRLLLASGASARDSAAFAKAVEVSARGEGLRCTRIRRGAGLDEAQELVAATVGLPLGLLGADPLVREAWSALPGLRPLGSLLAAHTSLSESSDDLVVVDAGDLDECLALVALPDLGLRLLDSAMTPRLAMARRPEVDVFDQLSVMRARLASMARMLASDDTAVRIALGSCGIAPGEVAGSVAALRLHGVHVDGVTFASAAGKTDKTGKTGKTGKSAGKKAKTRMRAHARDLGRAVFPAATWGSKAGRWRARPKGRSVLGPFESGPAGGLTPDSIGLIPDNEGYTQVIALPEPLLELIEVGRQGTSLVLRWRDQIRWLELPSVLVRCLPRGASIAGGVLLLRWQPDPQTWREGMSTQPPTGPDGVDGHD